MNEKERNCGKLHVKALPGAALVLFLVSLGLFLGSCEKKEAPVSSSTAFSQDQLSSRFPADLGSPTTVVSGYPQEIQDGYKIFLAICSSCHTSARPLNSTYIKAYDWKRFVQRMHVKMGNNKFNFAKSDEKKIVEFLVYDAKIRKVNQKAQFEQERKRLEELFAEVSKERERLILEETERLPKKETPYVGVK